MRSGFHAALCQGRSTYRYKGKRELYRLQQVEALVELVQLSGGGVHCKRHSLRNCCTKNVQYTFTRNHCPPKVVHTMHACMVRLKGQSSILYLMACYYGRGPETHTSFFCKLISNVCCQYSKYTSIFHLFWPLPREPVPFLCKLHLSLRAHASSAAGSNKLLGGATLRHQHHFITRT